MTALLIAVIFVFLYSMYDSGKRKEKADNYFNSTNGSRKVEKEEWERWTKQLYNEYCELAGMEKINFDKLGMHPFRVQIRYGEISHFQQLHWDCDLHKIFGIRTYSLSKYENLPTFTDRKIIEKLRKRHELPSDYELNSTILGTTDGSTNYKSLYDLMLQCVKRAVKRRGFQYGGTDYTAEKQRYENLKRLQEKYDWLGSKKK